MGLRKKSQVYVLDVLWKIRPCDDRIRQRSQENWVPSGELAIDEVTVGFHGRKAGFAVKLRGKKDNHGAQADAVAESSGAAYVWSWGWRPDVMFDQLEGRKDHGAHLSSYAARRAVRLMGTVTAVVGGKYRRCYMDNLYMGLELCKLKLSDGADDSSSAVTW